MSQHDQVVYKREYRFADSILLMKAILICTKNDNIFSLPKKSFSLKNLEFLKMIGDLFEPPPVSTGTDYLHPINSLLYNSIQ